MQLFKYNKIIILILVVLSNANGIDTRGVGNIKRGGGGWRRLPGALLVVLDIEKAPKKISPEMFATGGGDKNVSSQNVFRIATCNERF